MPGPPRPPPRTLRSPKTLPPGAARVPGSRSGPPAPGDGQSGPAYLKTPPRRQSAKVRPKSPGQSQVSWCRARAGPLPGGGGWARWGGGRSAGDLWVPGGGEKENRAPQSANRCTSPNSSGSQGQGTGSWSSGRAADPTRLLVLLQEGSGGRVRRAQIRPPFRRVPPPLSFPCSGPSRRPWPWPWPRASRRLPASPPPARQPESPAPGRRRASSRARAGSARGACSRTDWRCPAGRLEGAPTSRPPAPPPRSARGRERLPAGPRWAAAAPPGGARPGAGAAAAAAAATAARMRCSRGAEEGRGGFPPGPRRGYRSWLGGRGAAPRPEVCPGSGAARSLWEWRWDRRPAAPRPGGGASNRRRASVLPSGASFTPFAGPASPPLQGPLSPEAAGKPSPEVGEAPKRPWLLFARGRGKLAGAREGAGPASA